MLIRLHGLKVFVDRHGRQRVYHRKTGRPLTSRPGSLEFIEKYLELCRHDIAPGSGKATKRAKTAGAQ